MQWQKYLLIEKLGEAEEFGSASPTSEELDPIAADHRECLDRS
jgi:hypothetical protein